MKPVEPLKLIRTSLISNFSRQSGTLSSVPQASSPVTPEQQAAAQATPMPQQQGNITRNPATIHPYGVDTRGMAVSTHIKRIGLF